jgi:hypothetical protein
MGKFPSTEPPTGVSHQTVAHQPAHSLSLIVSEATSQQRMAYYFLLHNVGCRPCIFPMQRLPRMEMKQGRLWGGVDLNYLVFISAVS